MNKILLAAAAVLFLTQGAAYARDEAPTPRAAPRTAVNRQAMPDHKPDLPPSHTLEGPLTVLDSEKLHIGNVDVRLFGVVPPQLSASYGPQARAALDSMVAGQNVNCMVHDRDQSGRFLATCRTAAGNDLALELLRRGLAVTARGSLASSDLAITYISAEQTAQAQKTGLWSGVTPAPALQAVAPKPAPEVKVEAPKAEAPKAEAVIIPPPAPPAPLEAKKEAAKIAAAVEAPKLPAPQLNASSLAATPEEALAVTGPSDQPNFLMRYQLLITGFIMLATALSILTVVSRQRRQEKEDELKATAAALRGELMAARAVCQARLKTITSDAEDKAAIWPRIRSTLYQAYVGRLGILGAELARQVASIYGQSSDYAAYYNTNDDSREGSPKKQALQTLMQHIEEVLPKLAAIEYTGKRVPQDYGAAPAPMSMSVPASPLPPRPPVTVEHNVTTAIDEKPAAEEVTAPQASEETSMTAEAQQPLWQSVRKFARSRFVKPANAEGEMPTDYASLIEDDMSNLTFGEGEDMPVTAENVTKLRETGS